MMFTKMKTETKLKPYVAVGSENMDNKKLPNIYQRLSAISTELSVVAKNTEVNMGRWKYSAVGEADVLRAVKPLEAKHGVYSYPAFRTIIESGEIESVTFKDEIKKQLFERIETTYRFVNIDEPSDYIEIISYGDGIDSQDKSVGKAMTYADKYALLKAYKIVTGEDPDQDGSADLKRSNIKKEVKQRDSIEPNDLIFLQNYIEKSPNESYRHKVYARIEEMFGKRSLGALTRAQGKLLVAQIKASGK